MSSNDRRPVKRRKERSSKTDRSSATVIDPGVQVACDLLRLANADLADLNVTTALEKYTTVLIQSPGHPCAFLNRSICYLVLDFPHLAASDAYRALLAAQWAKTGDSRTSGMQLLGSYQACRQAVLCGEDWALIPTCYVGAGKWKWLEKHLASLALTPSGRSATRTTPSQTARRSGAAKSEMVPIANEAMLKAYYLLAISLWKCGGGAIRSAMDMTHQARDLAFCGPHDARLFQELEDFLLSYILREAAEERKLEPRTATAEQEEQKRKSDIPFEQLDIHQVMLSRYTRASRELYPWDKHSITDEGSADLERTTNLVKKFTSGCTLLFAHEAGKAPKLSLGAPKAGDETGPLFSEDSALNVVSTWSPRDMLVCDICAATLKVTEDVIKRAEVVAKFEFMRYHGRDFSDHEEEFAEVCSKSIFEQVYDASAHRPTECSPDSDPYKSRWWDSPPYGGFRVCSGCFHAVFCDNQCYLKAINSFHRHNCSRGPEDRIRMTNALSSYTFPGAPEEPRQLLLSLLLNRLLSQAITTAKSMLATTQMRITDGDLDAPRGYVANEAQARAAVESFRDDRTKPTYDIFPELNTAGRGQMDRPDNLIAWSFNVHVRQPINALASLGGPAVAMDITRFDGWMLQTLIAKLDAGMRISPCGRFQKTIGPNGETVAETHASCDSAHRRCCSQTRAEWDRSPPSEHATPKFWLASFHPLSNLIRPAEGREIPNVKLETKGQTLRCHRLQAVLQPSTSFLDGQVQSDKDGDALANRATAYKLVREAEAPRFGRNEAASVNLLARCGDDCTGGSKCTSTGDIDDANGNGDPMEVDNLSVPPVSIDQQDADESMSLCEEDHVLCEQDNRQGGPCPWEGVELAK